MPRSPPAAAWQSAEAQSAAAAVAACLPAIRPRTRASWTLATLCPNGPTLQGGYTHFMEKEIFEQPETIAQTMQGRVKITPLSPMKYAVPGIDPYLMPRVRMGGLVDHVSVSRAFEDTADWGQGTSMRSRVEAATADVPEPCWMLVTRLLMCRSRAVY